MKKLLRSEFWQSFFRLTFKSIVLAVLLLTVHSSFAQQWTILGNDAQISPTASAYTSISVLDNVPYVVFRDGTVGKVKKRNASGVWEQVGDNIGTNVSYTSLFNDRNNNLYVTYVEGSNGSRLAVRKYNEVSLKWEPLNNNSVNLYVSSGTVNGMSGVTQYSSTPRCSMAFDGDNNPYIAFGDGANLTPYVKMFDGTSWITIGSGPVNAAAKAAAVTLVVDEADVPWLAYCSLSTATSTTGSMTLYSNNNGVWVPATATTITGIRHTSMALNSAGNLTIAYFNTNSTNRATIIVYNKTAGTWSTTSTLSTRDAPNLSLIRDLSGNLYCSFIDAITTAFVNAGRVFKQSAGTATWRELKDPTITNGIDQPVEYLTIAVGSDTSKPFVAYVKTNSSSIKTPVVRMFVPPAAPAVLTTKAPTNFTSTSIVTGGNITSDGGTPITQRGVVYGTTSFPTTANNKIADASGGIGSYTVPITGLTPASIYYVRAYAINASGTTYGDNVKFITPDVPDVVVSTPKQMEYLTRGVVAVRTASNKVYVGWRMLGTDPSNIAFNVYRDGVKLNATPLTSSTNFEDNTPLDGIYTVKPVINSVEAAASKPASVWAQNYLNIPLQKPADGVTPDGVAYSYKAQDCSVGDLDGDGEYEIILKWDPSNYKDNSQSGYTGNVYLDAYKLNGTRLWRIDLGRNIRGGSHYTQFMVYDLDGDGKAELACKTADATIDGKGVVIGDPNADYRNAGGYVLSGPEFLTIFNGETGAAMATTNYLPARGNVSDWGDAYGNRVDRFIAAIAYLDGSHPTLIMGRGYYTRLVRAVWDWKDGKLTLRWIFDSNDASSAVNSYYAGQGNHQMTIGDADGDGKQEIFNGSSAINDNGKGLWSNGMGHGDALHMSDMDPDRPGLEIWMPYEYPPGNGQVGAALTDAKTGERIFTVSEATADVGRAMAADIDPSHKGYEVWAARGNLYDAKGVQITTSKPTLMNFAIWWDGDLSRELLDGTSVWKWDYINNTASRMFTPVDVSSNNSTKATPNLQADLFGDWREEVIFKTTDEHNLRIYTTTIPTDYRFYTLMHDPQYRTAIAWQNSAYNQPPHPGFYLGTDMDAPPTPNIITIDKVAPEVSTIARQVPSEEKSNATSVTYRVVFSETVNSVDASDFALTATGNVTGNIASVAAVSSSVYDVTVDNITGDGTLRLDVKSSYTTIADEQNNALNGGFETGETYTFDHTAPTLSPVIIASNNAKPALAKEGDVVTLNFTASENITNLEVIIAGHQVTATPLDNNQYSATYTLTSSDAEGVVPFSIQFKDELGNAGITVNAATDQSTVIYDRTVPTLPSVVILSNNANTSYAKEGDIVTLNFTVSETTETPGVTIAGKPVTLTGGGSNSYSASYTMTASDAEGGVAFTIDVIDPSGNTGTQVTATSDNSVVTYDRTNPVITAPADVTKNVDAGSCSATMVGLGIPSTDDNFKVASVTNNSPASYSFGTTIIIWTATDAAGNSATATQTVTVTDNQKPELTVPPTQIFCYSGNSYSIPSLSAKDNCGVASVSYTITGATQRSGSGLDASGSFGVGESTITWTVTDIHNNQSKGSSTVTINPPFSASIADVYAVSQATDNKNTLYIGYGPSSLTISATPAGGTAPYTYKWTTGQTTTSISVTAVGTYTVTITDTKGCTASASITINVVDVSCGNNKDKVMICHNGATICVASNAVQEHLSHGDQLGTCATTRIGSITTAAGIQESTLSSAPNMSIYPNPSAGQFILQLYSDRVQKVEVMIIDMNGRVVAQKSVNMNEGFQTLNFNITNHSKGVYLVKVVSTEGTKTQKIVVQK